MSEPCICWSLSSDPYKCKACWPEGGSKKEKTLFFDTIRRAREEVEAVEKKIQNK